MDKIIIYQVVPRLFGNENKALVKNGMIAENGVGKFSAFTHRALGEIKKLGVTHIWYTGVIEHATQTDYASFGIMKDHPTVPFSGGKQDEKNDHHRSDNSVCAVCCCARSAGCAGRHPAP